MKLAQAINEDQYAEIVEAAAIERCLDLGVASIITVTHEGEEIYLVSTTSGQYAKLN